MDSERTQDLTEVKNLIADTDSWMAEILSTFNWTEEHLLVDERVCCPNNPQHVVHQKSLPAHSEICPHLSNGYTRKELEEDSSSAFYYERTKCVVPIHIDEGTMRLILSSCGTDAAHRQIPVTMDRYFKELTPQERLKIYEFCVDSAKAMNKPVSIPEEELLLLEDTKKGKGDKGNPPSYLEKIAAQRDFKRRRQSYRAKNVHITKKTHTEVIREVLNNQMEILAEMWDEEHNQKVQEKRENDKMAVKPNRSRRSRSKDRYRSRSRDRKRRSKSRERSTKSRYRRSRSRGRRSRSKERKSRGRRSMSRGRRSRSRESSSQRKKTSDRKRVKKSAVNLWSLGDEQGLVKTEKDDDD